MSSAAQVVSRAAPRSSLLREYAQLCKARVTALVSFTAWCGAALATEKSGVSPWSPRVFAPVLGIACVAAGTAAFNQLIERDVDSRMRRTQMRPLVTGTISPSSAAIVSTLLVSTGLLSLLIFGNFLTALLSLVTSATYLCAYTPLKRRHPICTFVGAYPGAMPAVLGWTAVRGRVEWEAIALFAILFFWQFPHFHSIGLLYKEDYARAGIQMLAVVDHSGKCAADSSLRNSILLIAVSVVPFAIGMESVFYVIGAGLLGVGLVAVGNSLRRETVRGNPQLIRVEARRLLMTTVVYLPLLLTLMVATARTRIS